MKILYGLIFILFTLPLVSSTDVTLTGPGNVAGLNQFDVNVEINAPSIVGYELDVVFDPSEVSFVSKQFLDSSGQPISSPPYTCTNFTNTNNITLACANINPGGDPAGTYVRITFQALSAVQTTITPINSIITNETNNNVGGYSGIVENPVSVTITPTGFSYGTPVTPATISVDNVVNVTYPLTFTTPGTISVPPPSEYSGNNYWLDNGTVITAVPVAGNGNLQLTLNSGNTYNLIVETNTPTFSKTFEISDYVYQQDFTISSPSNFLGVYGNTTVNNTYKYWWLYWDNGTGLELVNIKHNIVFDDSAQTVSFENIDISSGTENFQLFGNITCQNNWVATSSWSACTNNLQQRTQTDFNYCTAPYVRTVTQSCSEGGTTTGGSGGGGGGGGEAVEKEYTTTTEHPDGDVLRSVVTYTAYGESSFSVSYEDFEVDAGETYAGFVLDSSLDLTPDKISNVEITFTVNNFWIDSNGITDIELYQLEDDTWKKLTLLESEGEYTAFTNKLGSFVIVGFIPEQVEDKPQEIEPKAGDKSAEEVNTGTTFQTGQLYKFGIPILLGTLVLVAIIVGVVMHARHPAQHGHPKKVVHDKLDQVADYVKKAKAAGLTEDKIKENLKRVGWTDEVVNKAFSS